MSLSDKYDYIITGAGAAGLSLLMHMIASGGFRDKRILLVDWDAKKKNDRTWCFWEKGEGLFEPIVFKQWEHLDFHTPLFSKNLSILPYRYKLIRGIDFYQHCLHQIEQHPNIHFIQASVERLFSQGSETGAVIEGKEVRADYVFNSILFDRPRLAKNQYWLLQHFKGWRIRTEAPVFDASRATLMDFRTKQDKGTSFLYMLPFSDNEALVEYTLFSGELLAEGAYDAALKHYIEQLWGIGNYQVEETEFGVIPMTNYSFPARQHNIIHIGTAGGQTKGSSGYTFRFIQKHSAALVQSLQAQGHPFAVEAARKRFHFYDSVLLNILHHRKLEGSHVFEELFRMNEPQQIFKFLDNETSLVEDMRILSTLPIMPFTLAAVNHLTVL
jgi:lycopene beta-cyclase